MLHQHDNPPLRLVRAAYGSSGLPGKRRLSLPLQRTCPAITPAPVVAAANSHAAPIHTREIIGRFGTVLKIAVAKGTAGSRCPGRGNHSFRDSDQTIAGRTPGVCAGETLPARAGAKSTIHSAFLVPSKRPLHPFHNISEYK